LRPHLRVTIFHLVPNPVHTTNPCVTCSTAHRKRFKLSSKICIDWAMQSRTNGADPCPPIALARWCAFSPKPFRLS